jgi:ketosteroid isomerase-like protein
VDNTVGRDAWVAAMRRILEDFEDPVSEVEDILDAGDDRVMAIVRSSGIGKRNGALVEMCMAQVYWLETGRIVRAVPFLDPNDALKAEGLRE